MFITAIQMVDTVNNGLAFCNQTRDHQGGGSAQIGGHHGRAGEFFGYWGFFAKLAGVIGPAVFGTLAADLGYRPAILVNAGFFVIGLVVLIPLTLPSRHDVTES